MEDSSVAIGCNVRYADRRKETVAVLQYPVMYRYAYSRAIPGNTVLNVVRVPVALRVRVYPEYAVVMWISVLQYQVP